MILTEARIFLKSGVVVYVCSESAPSRAQLMPTAHNITVFIKNLRN